MKKKKARPRAAFCPRRWRTSSSNTSSAHVAQLRTMNKQSSGTLNVEYWRERLTAVRQRLCARAGAEAAHRGAARRARCGRQRPARRLRQPQKVDQQALGESGLTAAFAARAAARILRSRPRLATSRARNRRCEFRRFAARASRTRRCAASGIVHARKLVSSIMPGDCHVHSIFTTHARAAPARERDPRQPHRDVQHLRRRADHERRRLGSAGKPQSDSTARDNPSRLAAARIAKTAIEGRRGKARAATAGKDHKTEGSGGFDNGLYGTGAGNNK